MTPGRLLACDAARGRVAQQAGPSWPLLSTPTPPALPPPRTFQRGCPVPAPASAAGRAKCSDFPAAPTSPPARALSFERKGASLLSSPSLPRLLTAPAAPGSQGRCPQRSPEPRALPWRRLSGWTSAQGSTRNHLEASGSGRATGPLPACRDTWTAGHRRGFFVPGGHEPSRRGDPQPKLGLWRRPGGRRTPARDSRAGRGASPLLLLKRPRPGTRCLRSRELGLLGSGSISWQRAHLEQQCYSSALSPQGHKRHTFVRTAT